MIVNPTMMCRWQLTPRLVSWTPASAGSPSGRRRRVARTSGRSADARKSTCRTVCCVVQYLRNHSCCFQLPSEPFSVLSKPAHQQCCRSNTFCMVQYCLVNHLFLDYCTQTCSTIDAPVVVHL